MRISDKSVLILLLPMFSSLLFAQGQNPGRRATDLSEPAVQDDRYLIEFRSWGAQAAATVRGAGGRVAMEFPALRAIAAHLPPQAVQALQNNPNISLVEPDARRYPMSTGGAGAARTPYGITMVQADQIPQSFTGVRTVCIIDSGYFLGHEDLQSTNVTASDDPGTGNALTDKNGHGTHVAGTIAALANNIGVVGVHGGGKLNLHIVKVFGDNGAWAYSSSLIAALDRCRQNNANVVNMSLGGSVASQLENTAFTNAYNAGVLSVAAAGNAGNTAKSYPASYASVISVAAVDSKEVVADFSQKNDAVELAGPGVGVESTVPFLETNTVTASDKTYSGTWIENAARSTGRTGSLVDGGLCSTTSSSWSGKVVLCERGTVSFYDKVRNVQNSGGVATVIYNNVSGGFAGTLGAGNTSTIPAIGISREDGLVLKPLNTSATVVSNVSQGVSGYEAWNGTSMATPHVAGVAAVIWAHHPAKSNAEIRTALQKTAKDLGAAGRDNSYGFGLVQAKAALDFLSGVTTGDQTPPVISAVNSARVSNNGTFQITWTTNEPANSEVTFTGGTTGTFTSSGLRTSHSMQFKGSRNVVYTYYVSSTDAAGNKATVGPRTHHN
jgi:serine protease